MRAASFWEARANQGSEMGSVRFSFWARDKHAAATENVERAKGLGGEEILERHATAAEPNEVVQASDWVG